MTRDEYQKMTLAEMKRKSWRTRTPIETGAMAIPAGSVVSVIGKHGGLEIIGPKCPHCGLAAKARKVPFALLAEVREG